MLSFTPQLRIALGSYIAGLQSVDDLHTWLALHVETAVAESSESRRLLDKVWFLIDGYSDGLADEGQLRSAILDVLSAPTMAQESAAS